MRSRLKRLFAAVSVLLLLSSLLTLIACKKSEMPFNGVIEFHDITAVIPDSYVRDSTQSTDDFWVFEKGGYKEYILLSRTVSKEDPAAVLDDYEDAMRDVGAETTRGNYLNTDAVISKYEKDGLYCQEIFFSCSGSFYSFALRGGTEKEFTDLLGDIITP